MRIVFICALLWSGVLSAQVQIVDPWVRAAPPNAHVLGAFMVLENNGNKAVWLEHAHTSSDYGSIEIHRTQRQGDMMRMRSYDRVYIAAKDKKVFQPGSWHLMLIKPKRVPIVGEQIPIWLRFDSGERVQINFPVLRSR